MPRDRRRLKLKSLMSTLAFLGTAAGTPVKSNMQKIPLVRNEPRHGADDFARLGHIQSDQARLKRISKRTNNLQAQMESTMNVPAVGDARDATKMVSHGDHTLLWTALIDVGTPKKQFAIDLDTGSADLVIAASGCPQIENQYNPSRSSSMATFPTGEISFDYGTINMTGFAFEDEIHMGNLTVRQKFGAFLNVSGTYDGIDGIAGLAFPSLSSIPDTDNLVTNLFNQKQISRNIFSVALSDTQSHMGIGWWTRDLLKGDMSWQAYPEAKADHKDYWYYTIGLRLENEGTKGMGVGVQGIVDTGTAHLLLEESAFNDFFTGIPGMSYNDEYSAMEFDCLSNATVTLSVGPKDYEVPLTHFNAGRLPGTEYTCVTSIVNGFEETILGDAFLRDWYAVFDQGTGLLGFGPAKYSRVL